MSIAGVGSGTWRDFSTTALKDVVQGWVNGTYGNYGVMIMNDAGNENDDGAHRFYSDDQGSSAPQIWVDYTIYPTATPTNTPTNTPTATNTPTSTPSNTPTPIPTMAERTIDDGDAGYAQVGTWTYTSAGGTEPLNGDYYAGSTVTGASTRNTTWTPNLNRAGNYEVYVRYRMGTNRAPDAPYTVYYNGGSATVDVNQTINGGAWVSIGTYAFNAGTSGYVRLNNGPATKNKQVISDGVRFTPR